MAGSRRKKTGVLFLKAKWGKQRVSATSVFSLDRLPSLFRRFRIGFGAHPTKSQFPSSVLTLTENPRGSLAESDDPLSPPTVEKRAMTGDFLPFSRNCTQRRGRVLVSPCASLVQTDEAKQTKPNRRGQTDEGSQRVGERGYKGVPSTLPPRNRT